MLVLSRHREERIFINRGDKIRLGIEAEPEITILRGKLIERSNGR